MTPEAAREAFARSPLHRLYGMELELVEGGVDLYGSAFQDLARTDDIPNLHGGAIAAMLDSAATFALMTTTDRRWATVDIRVDYLSPAPLHSLALKGRVIKAGGRIGRARAELQASYGTVVAVATGTFAAEPDRSAS